MSNTLFKSLDLSHNLSFVHYNVQSVYSKLDLLEAELIEFDILARYKIQESLLRIFGPHRSTYRHGISVTNIG